MKKVLILVIGICLVMPRGANAEEESWFTYWALGWAPMVDGPGSYNSNMDELAELDGFSRISICLDMLGFYFAVDASPNLIVGGVINATGDRISDGSEHIQLNLYLMGPSVMYFLGDHAGEGAFVRADAGLAVGVVTSSGADDESSDPGFGGLIGVGYGIPVGEGSRLLLGANLTRMSIEDNGWGSLGLTIGGLF